MQLATACPKNVPAAQDVPTIADLRKRRTSAGLSMREVALEMGFLTQRHVYKLEKGLTLATDSRRAAYDAALVALGA